MPAKKQSDFQLDWTTITYRSIIMMVGAVTLAVLVVLYFIFPDQSHRVLAKSQNYAVNALNRIAGNHTTSDTPSNVPQQARFTSFDGTVRVKRVNSNTWVPADYSLPLEKGDVVQTMSEGIAKVAFADGSTYSIQPDSLITIEENTTNAQSQVQVAVRLQTGTFQLNTGDLNSTQQVRIDNATTTIGKDSALEAVNDRKKGAPAVLVTKGTGTFEINGEKTAVAPYERVQFNPDTGDVKKQKEIAPPVLLAPANMMPVFISGSSKGVEFSWTPVEGVQEYHIRISKNPYFSSVEKEAKVNSSDYKLSGLPEGKYYWVVQSVDEHGKESIASDTNGFSIVSKGNENVSLPLELLPFIQHGHVIEIKGKTEQGARVMVNGEQVPVVNDDGSFIYFTPPMPAGQSVVTITAQNKIGGVRTTTQTVLIQ